MAGDTHCRARPIGLSSVMKKGPWPVFEWLSVEEAYFKPCNGDTSPFRQTVSSLQPQTIYRQRFNSKTSVLLEVVL